MASLSQLSLVQGLWDVPLTSKNLSSIILEHCTTRPDEEAIVSVWQKQRLSFRDLQQRTRVLARALISNLNLRRKDHVGALAGNRYEVIELFLASTRIGRTFVPLNPTNTPDELCRAVLKQDCKIVFLAERCGNHDFGSHLEALLSLLMDPETALEALVLLDLHSVPEEFSQIRGLHAYQELTAMAARQHAYVDSVTMEEGHSSCDDQLTLQSTSGTTGDPKAAILTHRSAINNALLLGQRLGLIAQDVVCNPAPLFRPFGLIMGFLTAFVHGATCVLPSEEFDAILAATSIIEESCTVIISEPPTFIPILDAIKSYTTSQDVKISRGLTAGAILSVDSRVRLHNDLGLSDLIMSYGQTETGPITFITSPDHAFDDEPPRLIMPHTSAKIVDPKSNATVPRGTCGEICVSGYGMMQGYYNDDEKTQETQRKDDDGVVWHHTGDEGFMDRNGGLFVRARLNDIIVLADGRKVYPGPVEQRLLEHSDVGEACVVPIECSDGTQLVGAVLKRAQVDTNAELDVAALRAWVVDQTPALNYVWWIGDTGIGEKIPKTYNGKPRKRELSQLLGKLLERST